MIRSATLALSCMLFASYSTLISQFQTAGKVRTSSIKASEVPMISNGALAGASMKAPTSPFPSSQHQSPALPPFEQYADAPVLSTSFETFEFDDNATENGGSLFIPPDPHGAAGPDRVIAVVNCMMEARTKVGVLLYRDALDGFFAPLSPTTATFDPKVLYDQYEGRFLVVTLEQVEGAANPDAGNISRILLAVSKTSSPATATSADWYYHAIDAKTLISGSEYWADYPGFAVDEEAVYITNNMFRFITNTFSGVRLWIVGKTSFYSGGAAGVAIYDPYASAGSATTTQPAHVFGVGGVPGGAGLIGTFLVSYSGLSSGGSEFVQVVRVDSPLGAPTFTQEYVSVGDIDATATATLPDASQLGTTTPVEVNDRRALNAVWRSGALWLTATLIPPSGPDISQTTAHWFKLSTALVPGGAITLSDQGDIGGEDIATTTYTFFPSVAVNATGDIGIGFAACAPTIYPGAYFTGRFSTDLAGTNRGSGVLRAGLDYYVRTFGGPRNRWGDYSGACIDPSDGSFWIFNEYAMTRGTMIGVEDGRWKTAWGNFPASALPIQLASFTGSVVNGNSVRLNWQTISEVNNYGFEIEKSLGNANNYQSVPNSFVAGHGTTSEPHSYTFTEPNVGQGTWYYRLKQIDLNGSSNYHEGVRVDVLLTGVESSALPAVVSLQQNYPNPFNPATLIPYSVSGLGFVTIKIYDVLGREVATLVDGVMPGGEHQVQFDASNLASGVYTYRLTVGDNIATRKLIVAK